MGVTHICSPVVCCFTCVTFTQQLNPHPHQIVSVTFRALQVTKKVDILTPLGALYYNTGRYEEALQVYREATSLQPDNTDIWLAFVSMLHTNTKTSTTLKLSLFAQHGVLLAIIHFSS